MPREQHFQGSSLSLCTVFFNDILVYSISESDHLSHIRVVFQILRHQQLFVNAKKSVFGQSRIEYLGYIISPEGVPADPNKVQAMLD